MAATRACVLALCAVLLASPVWGQGMGEVIDSHATFYGGRDASGTMGGACGYGNLYTTGYGTATAAASVGMWNGGAICGSCWQVWCVNNKYCINGATVTITVTNMCPQGSEGGWCDAPKRHLDMAYPSWAKIASDPMAGVVSTQMKRVPCPVDGGVSFTIGGHPYYLQVLVFNVGGSGDVVKVEASWDDGTTYTNLDRNWGSVWTVSTSGFTGKALSFKITNGLVPDTLEVKGACGANWYFGGTCKSGTNFNSGNFGASSSLRNRVANNNGPLPAWLQQTINKGSNNPGPKPSPSPKPSPKPSNKAGPKSAPRRRHRRRRGKRGLGRHRLKGAKHRRWKKLRRAHA